LKARELTHYVLDNFSEDETGLFYFTDRQQKDIIVRKKEIYDGALPSGNAVMIGNLYYLSIVFDILIIIEFTINIVAGDSSMTIEYLSSRSRPDSTKKGPQMLIELRGTCWANRRSGFSSGDRSARRRT